jgi:hypothetical protein
MSKSICVVARSVAFLLATGACLTAASGSNGLTSTTVHRPGDPVPGMPGFTMNGVGGLASINDAGEVIFSAAIAGDGVTLSNDNVLIAGPLDDLRVVGRERDPVANLPGWIHLPGSVNSTGFGQLIAAPDGGIAYRASIFETGVSTTWHSGMFAGSVTTPAPFVWVTGPAPGYDPAYIVNQVFTVALADGGRAVVSGQVFGPTFANVVWVTDPVNGPAVVLSTDRTAPGFGVGIEPVVIRDASIRMNAQGRLTTLVILEGPGIFNSNRGVWYEGLPGGLGVLARQGEPVPGLTGASYTIFDERKMRLNASGDLCFATQISGGGTTAAFMRRRGGVLAPLVKVGDPVPEVPGATFTNLFGGHFDLNAQGNVMFGATLTGQPASSDSAWFIAGDDGVRMVLREGDPLPGGLVTPEISGVKFYFNDRDQFVFDFNGTFYASRPDGSLVKLAAATEPYFTNDGFSGVVGAIVPWRLDSESLGTGSGRPCFFNNRGEFILSMYFTGSTGTALVLFDIDDPCPADLVPPFGLLDLNDINAFVNAFVSGDPQADLDGSGLIDLTDVNIFVASFTAGCPD